MQEFSLVRLLYIFFLKLVNCLFKKRSKTLLFYPNINCLYDKYDIINYHSDNVLCLLNYIISRRQFEGYEIYLVYYNKERLNEYILRCNNSNNFFHFIYYANKWDLYKAFFRSKIVFVDNIYVRFYYKLRSQIVVCLGYYMAPYKDDYYRIKELIANNKERQYSKYINKSFDYYITTSDICSRFLSNDTCLNLSKFLSLGFPRNDIFYEENIILREKLCKTLGRLPRYIICYAPTHRDYENSNRSFYNEEFIHKRSLFGYTDSSYDNLLDLLLNEIDAVIVAKIHPFQVKNNLIDNKSKRIVFYHDLEKVMDINLQLILQSSDILITDYSTTCYDFLNLDKPIIYYTYDENIYLNNRGLFIDPIKPLNAGETINTMDELLFTIRKILNGDDLYKMKRKFVKELLDKNCDGFSSCRIADYFLNKRFEC